MNDDLILVVDFGAQYAQLIARRVREANVYSEIVPRDMPVAEMLARRPKGIIFSGGPSSVHVEGAPQVDPSIYDSGVPVLGICYGCQLIAQQLGGEVRRTGSGEYGRTPINVIDSSLLFANLPVTGGQTYSLSTFVSSLTGLRTLSLTDSSGAQATCTFTGLNNR